MTLSEEVIFFRRQALVSRCSRLSADAAAAANAAPWTLSWKASPDVSRPITAETAEHGEASQAAPAGWRRTIPPLRSSSGVRHRLAQHRGPCCRQLFLSRRRQSLCCRQLFRSRRRPSLCCRQLFLCRRRPSPCCRHVIEQHRIIILRLPLALASRASILPLLPLASRILPLPLATIIPLPLALARIIPLPLALARIRILPLSLLASILLKLSKLPPIAYGLVVPSRDKRSH